MVDDGSSEVAKLNKMKRGSGVHSSDEHNMPTKRPRRLGASAENVDPDRLLALPDEDRQRDFADKIVKVSPGAREKCIDEMVDRMRFFEPVSLNKIFDAVIDDFENEGRRWSIAGTLEDATWRGNLTTQQLDRVFSIRMANPDAERVYKDNVHFNYDNRLWQRREGQNTNDRTQATDRGAPHGLKLTSVALNYHADRLGRLEKFAEASEILADDAKTARDDMIAAKVRLGGRGG